MFEFWPGMTAYPVPTAAAVPTAAPVVKVKALLWPTKTAAKAAKTREALLAKFILAEMLKKEVVLLF